MKYLFLLGFLNLFIMCNSQKQDNKLNINTKKADSIEREFFYSNENGGTLRPSFSLIKNQSELDAAIGQNLVLSKNEEAKLKFPKNKILIKYNLGEFRSGDHTPTKINRYKVENDILYVFIDNKNARIDTSLGGLGGEMSIQVVTRPYMIFAVPKELKFNNIILKHE